MLRQLLTTSQAAVQGWAKGTSAQCLKGMLERRLLWPRCKLVAHQVIPLMWPLYEMQTVFLWEAVSSLLLLTRCSSKDRAVQSASHLPLRCQENPGHPMRSHLPRLLFPLAPRFALGLRKYFCSASVLPFQSPCVVRQNPAASPAGWAGICFLTPSFPMGWEMDNPGGQGESHPSKVIWQHSRSVGRDSASPSR